MQTDTDTNTKTVKPDGGDLSRAREDFPSLERTHNGFPLAYFDGPGGTQVPRQVIDAVVKYYSHSNANCHGCFVTSGETESLLEETRTAVAAFLGAEGSRNISFGANMTTLNFSLSKAVARFLEKGDEILITQLDHEANRGPWLNLQEHALVVREVAVGADGTLDYRDFEEKITKRTRLVAMGYSSNAFGTVNDVPRVRAMTRQVGAWLLVDAVHHAPHFPLDAASLGADFLMCSAYKFYGPYVGILYSREGLLEELDTDRLRTQVQEAPYIIETGTLNHAALAGVKAAVEYIAGFGRGTDLRSRVVSAMERIGAHEHGLALTLYEALQEIPGLTLYGPSFHSSRRAPTLSFTLEGKRAAQVCTLLGEKGICAWDGHFYAIRPLEVLGLLEGGGLTRVGMSLYNTEGEVARLLEQVERIARDTG